MKTKKLEFPSNNTSNGIHKHNVAFVCGVEYIIWMALKEDPRALERLEGTIFIYGFRLHNEEENTRTVDMSTPNL